MTGVLVYDLEIKRCIPDRGQVHSGNIEYCTGWKDYTGMGISVACASLDGIMYTFVDDELCRPEYANMRIDGNLVDFGHLLAKAGYVVGFNNHSFDNNLMAAHHLPVAREKSYDIYVEVIDAAGLSNAPYSYRKGYKLDDIARANEIEGKTGSGGVMAPVLYQTGRMQELHAYCQHDVQMTVQVLERIMAGTLICPRSRNPLMVKTPQDRLGNTQPGMF